MSVPVISSSLPVPSRVISRQAESFPGSEITADKGSPDSFRFFLKRNESSGGISATPVDKTELKGDFAPLLSARASWGATPLGGEAAGLGMTLPSTETAEGALDPVASPQGGNGARIGAIAPMGIETTPPFAVPFTESDVDPRNAAEREAAPVAISFAAADLFGRIVAVEGGRSALPLGKPAANEYPWPDVSRFVESNVPPKAPAGRTFDPFVHVSAPGRREPENRFRIEAIAIRQAANEAAAYNPSASVAEADGPVEQGPASPVSRKSGAQSLVEGSQRAKAARTDMIASLLPVSVTIHAASDGVKLLVRFADTGGGAQFDRQAVRLVRSEGYELGGLTLNGQQRPVPRKG